MSFGKEHKPYLWIPVVIKETMNCVKLQRIVKRNRCWNWFRMELYFVNRAICGFWFKMKMYIIYCTLVIVVVPFLYSSLSLLLSSQKRFSLNPPQQVNNFSFFGNSLRSLYFLFIHNVAF